MPKKYTTQWISVGLGLLLVMSLAVGTEARIDGALALEKTFFWVLQGMVNLVKPIAWANDFVATVVGNAVNMAVRDLFPPPPQPKQEPLLDNTDKKPPSLTTTTTTTTRTFEWPNKDGTVALLSDIPCGGKPCPIIQHQAERRRTTAERVWKWVGSFMPPYAMSVNKRMLLSLTSLNLALLANMND